MKIQITIFVVLASLALFGQAPGIQWQKSFGGTQYDNACEAKQTPDGGYIVIGATKSSDGDVLNFHTSLTANDIWVLKLNANGVIQWQKALGGYDDDIASDVQITTDGGYIIAGNSSSNDGDVTGHHGAAGSPDAWIVKLDVNGNIEWEKSYGGTGAEFARSIIQTADKGYIFAGEANFNNGDVSGVHYNNNYDCWIVKIDSAGTLQWQKCLGGSNSERAYSIMQASTGGYIIGAVAESNNGDLTTNHGGYDYWVIKSDSLGNIQWQKTYGGSGNELSCSVIETFDGGYLATGTTGSLNGDVTGFHGGFYDGWVIKLTSSGITQWQKSLGGTFDDYLANGIQTVNKEYILGGFSSSNDGDVSGGHGNSDYWLIKVDSLGSILWQKTYGGSDGDFGGFADQTNDGGFILSGSSRSSDGDVTGNNGGQGGPSVDYWIVKLNSITGISEIGTNDNIALFPNPSRGKVTLNSSSIINEIEITDLLGQVIYKEKTNSPGVSLEIEKGGVYFLNVKMRSEIITRKIIVTE